MWKALRRALLVSLVALVAFAQTAAAQQQAPASVSGRVTDGERGLPGITVALYSNEPETRNRPVARARTDAEGHYHLTGVPPARYFISTAAPTYVSREVMGFQPGKPLTLAAGEAAEGVDFRLESGSVITGRVTDADGNPIIGEYVQLQTVDQGQRPPFPGLRFDPREMQTDDRGVYRIYGLAPGRYKVSVGTGEDMGAMRMGLARKLYRRTYHPDVEDAAEARVVELKAGDEAEDVDIKVARTLKTYKVSGRFVSAETGEPVPNVSYNFSVVDRQGRTRNTFGGGMPAGARGEFQADGLAPGRYTVAVTNEGAVEMYAEPTPFDVADADVSGVVVRLRRGATLSGAVQFEGAVDRAMAAKLLQQIRVYGNTETPGQMGPPPSLIRPQNLAPDGTFNFRGLPPGRFRLAVSGGSDNRGVTVSRIEYNGVTIREGIPVRDGEQVVGVRIVLAYGNGVIRGQLNVTGGTLPAGGRVMAIARRVTGAEDRGSRAGEVDARGRFLIEGLPPGDYEVRATIFGAGRPTMTEPQRVTVSDNSEYQVTLTLDVSAPTTPPKGIRP